MRTHSAAADIRTRGLLLLTGAALAVAVQLILLRRTPISPGAPFPWVIGGALLFLMATAAARRGRGATDRWSRFLPQNGAETAMGLLFFALLATYSVAFDRATGDGREYFVQLRSLVMDFDLQFANEIEHFRTLGVTWVMPPGTAIFWLPFYVAGHLWLATIGLTGANVLLDGYWNPYQQAVGLGTLVLGFIGAMLLYRLLAERYAASIAAASVWLMVGGTFLFYYLTVEATYAHGVGFFAVTWFVYLWLRWPAPRPVRRQIAIGLLGGLMTAVRWENSLYLLLLAVDELPRLGRAVSRRRWRDLLPLGALVIAGIVGFTPQLVVWQIYQQTVITVPEMAGEQWWDQPLVGDVLFSSNRGLIAWHPVFLLALAGLPLALRRDPKLIGAGVLIATGMIWATAASAWWAGGAGFGHRRLAGLIPIAAFGLAAAIDWSVRRPAVLVSALAMPAIVLNLAMTADVVAGRLPINVGAPFDRLAASVFARTGNPFSLPYSLWLAWRHGMPPARYDALGRQLFNDLDIPVGTSGDWPYLLHGWGDPETGASGSAFRWVVERKAGFVAPLRERLEVGARHPTPDYELLLSIEPFAGVEGQVLSLEVNGSPVSSVELEAGAHEVTFSVPSQSLRRNLNFFDFRFSEIASPRQLGISDDPRPLAARIARIYLRRLGE